MNLPRHIPATERRLIEMVGEKVHPAEMARRLGITRQALHQRLKRLQKQGKIPTTGRRICPACNRPYPPAPRLSREGRRLQKGKASKVLAKMGAKAAAKMGLDNGEQAK